jgi:uncharacterized membrane protein YbaN (DUF454 family)
VIPSSTHARERGCPMARHAIEPADEPILSRAKRAALLVLGTVMVALGVVGILLPVLPTTCFLLAAAACYGRSSERFYRWLFTNPLFGEYLRTYRDERAMPSRIKYGSMALLWISIGSSAVFFVDALWLRILLFGIAVAVTTHVASLRTLRRA